MKTTSSRLAVRFAFQNSSAFNLVEIMIAVSVSVIAIVSIMGIFPAVLNSVRDTENETKAGLLAQSIFSTLRSDYFDEVDLYGNKINLVTESGTRELYASQNLNITSTRDDQTVYLIQMKFNNDPTTYPGQAGNINHVSLVIYWSPPSDKVGSPPAPNTNQSAFTGLVAKTTVKPQP